MRSSSRNIGGLALAVAAGLSVLMLLYFQLFHGDGQVAFGISAVGWATAAFIFLVYSRMNTVQRTGTMALVFVLVVAFMLPFFFLAQAKVSADRTNGQYDKQLKYAAGLYATYCASCHGLLGQGLGAPQLNNGIPNHDTNPVILGWNSQDVQRVIAAGIVNNTNPTQYLMPQWSQAYGGSLNDDDINSLTALIMSSNDKTRNKVGAPTSQNGFDYIFGLLTADQQKTYNLQFAALNGPKDAPIDLTALKAVTVPIVDTPTDPSSVFKFLYTDPASKASSTVIKIKVGTTVTWDNVSSAIHSVSSGAPNADTTDFKSNSTVAVGSTYAVTFDKAGTFPYYCIYHPTMRAQVIVVP
ncbi:MAG: c-type cytochrome [Ktedonobacterales bacterium]|nr:c-type cytochrome [Ktedonobacterales bacterium]